MVNDSIGDLLIQIKNASMVGKKSLEMPYAKMKMAVAKILVDNGYLRSATVEGAHPRVKLHLELQYKNKMSTLTDVKRISKPGMRWYVGAKEIPTVLGGMGIAILSTPQGVMTGKSAKEKNLGGELLCEVW